MRPFLALTLALIGCSAETSTTALPAAAVPTPYSLSLGAPAMVAGETAAFVITNAAPGEQVYLALSQRGTGAGFCPPGLADCLDLIAPVTLIGQAPADGTGYVVIRVPVPESALYSSVHVQAASASGTSTAQPRFIDPPSSDCGYGIPAAECLTTDYTVSSGWVCTTFESCQDVYDISVPAGTQINVRHENLTGNSVSRMALFAPGEPLSGVNMLWGSAYDLECMGQDTDQISGVITLATEGTYRLAIGRDWGSSAGSAGNYDLTIEIVSGSAAVVQTVDDEASAALGSTCLF